MKTWVIWAAAAAGVLLGLIVVAYQRWEPEQPAQPVSYVIRTGSLTGFAL